MNRYPIALTLACTLCVASAHAQLYKSVGADGRITYGDRPAANAVRTEKKQLTDSVVDNSSLPFELAQVVKASPVTLYTGSNCPPCAQARTLLGARGIPFAEKSVTSNADIALVSGNAATSTIDLPQLQVGQSRLRGFDSSGWNASLTAVGYPTWSSLPNSYKNPSPRAAAAVVRNEIVTRETANEAATGTLRTRALAARPAAPVAVKPNGDTPPGFRF